MGEHRFEFFICKQSLSVLNEKADTRLRETPRTRQVVKFRMYRPNVKEFHRSFKPLLYISKICGMSPIEIQEMNGGLITRRSTFGYVQNVAFIMLYSGMLYFMKINNIMVMQLSGISLLVEEIQLFTFNLMFYVVLLPVIIVQKKFLHIIKSISELDLLLLQSGEYIDYRKEFKRNLILVGSLCVALGIVLLAAFLKSYQPGFQYIIHTLLWFLPLLFIHVVFLQFAIMVLSLKLRCSKLNNAISKMITNFANQQNLDVIANIEIDYRNSRVGYSGCNIENRIWNLSVIYDLICEICKTINRVFSFRLTFGLGVLCMFITFIIYGIAMYIKRATQPYAWDIVISKILGLLLNSSQIFQIIYCCSEAKSEIDQVAILLHKVKPRKMEHREALNTFSLRAMHQKVQFTASGLFILDYTFIYLVFSTITTYMVILVQFDPANNS